MKKLKLDDEADAGFRGLGIVSPEKDYRLCYLLNTELGLNFDKSVNLSYYDPAKNSRKPVDCFVHLDPETGNKLYLVKNKQEGFVMVPAMKQADFVFLEPDSQPERLGKIKQSIARFHYIQGCFAIPTQKLQHIDAE